MEQSKIGDFENFIIMATKTSGLSTSYSTFLDYKTVRTFLKVLILRKTFYALGPKVIPFIGRIPFKIKT